MCRLYLALVDERCKNEKCSKTECNAYVYSMHHIIYMYVYIYLWYSPMKFPWLSIYHANANSITRRHAHTHINACCIWDLQRSHSISCIHFKSVLHTPYFAQMLVKPNHCVQKENLIVAYSIKIELCNRFQNLFQNLTTESHSK